MIVVFIPDALKIYSSSKKRGGEGGRKEERNLPLRKRQEKYFFQFLGAIKWK